MDITVKDIYDAINSFAPFILQESWDNSGLQIGNLDDKIRNPVICLDVTHDAINTALKLKSNLIISHHPLFFKPLKSIDRKNKSLDAILSNNINIISAHTNFDVIPDGVSYCLAEKIGLKNTKILAPLEEQKFYKLSFFITEKDKDSILKELFTDGVGEFLRYEDCAFSSKGVGQFKPKDKAKPYVEKESFSEVRVEFIVRKDKLKECIKKLKKIHPYDEVAFDVFEEKVNPLELGYGVIGNISNAKKLYLILNEVKDFLGINKVKFKGDLNRKIKTIAVCGGSGSSFILNAIKEGADLYITGDLKYHDVLEHSDKIILADVGHRASEIPALERLRKKLEGIFNKINFNVFIENNDFYQYI
ncbi:MAG: Nif3-like dinuclear metal center hexameric protein [Proteobacteria bacterium]|nr:Nif3-like dinuclear metal center hexameric protein [Pseudomonadota bacterium]